MGEKSECWNGSIQTPQKGSIWKCPGWVGFSYRLKAKVILWLNIVKTICFKIWKWYMKGLNLGMGRHPHQHCSITFYLVTSLQQAIKKPTHIQSLERDIPWRRSSIWMTSTSNLHFTGDEGIIQTFHTNIIVSLQACILFEV